MKVLEWLVLQIVGPFLKGYIFFFGDDPEVIAYAGVAFVIFYFSVFIFFMAVFETVAERHILLRIQYKIRRWRMSRRVHRAVQQKLRKRELEMHVMEKIYLELLGKEEDTENI